MEQPIYNKGYRFLRLSFQHTHYTDNRAGTCPHYFAYMRSGRVRLVSANRSIEVGEGELFYIPASCRYQSYWSGEPDIYFDSLGFEAFLHEGQNYPLQKIPFPPEVSGPYFALTERDITINYETLGLFYLFLSAVLPYMEAGAVSHAKQTVDRALAYMEGIDHLSVPALARHCRISESALYAAFRTEEGCTPLAAWQKKQVARAAFLLRTTDLTVEAIAGQLGYCSTTYFRSVFRRYMGRSPRALRNEGKI